MNLANRLKTPFASPTTYYWKPIPEIDQTDADLVLITVSTGTTKYYEPVRDPLFQATVPFNYGDAKRTFYAPNHASNSLACTVQVSPQKQLQALQAKPTTVPSMHNSP